MSRILYDVGFSSLKKINNPLGGVREAKRRAATSLHGVAVLIRQILYTYRSYYEWVLVEMLRKCRTKERCGRRVVIDKVNICLPATCRHEQVELF